MKKSNKPNKFDLTASNEEASKVLSSVKTNSKIYNRLIEGLKFGRLITNWKDFYSLYLRDDIGYQIQGDFSSSFDERIISLINNFDDSPNLAACISAFESVIRDEQISFSKMSVQAFKNFESIGCFTIDGGLHKGYVPKLKN